MWQESNYCQLATSHFPLLLVAYIMRFKPESIVQVRSLFGSELHSFRCCCRLCLASMSMDGDFQLDANTAQTFSNLRTAKSPDSKSVAALGDDDSASANGSARGGRGRGRGGGRGSGAQATGRGHGGAKPTGPEFQCKGCLKKRPVSEQVPGFQYDRGCMRAYHAIGRLVAKQGEAEWWSDTKACPKKLAAAVQDYLKQCPEQIGRGKTRGEWKVSIYKETITSETAVERRAEGLFMWKDEYLEWAGTSAGGRLRRDQAEMKWTAWADPSSGVLREFSGPEHSRLQLRVVVGVKLDEISRMSRARALECQDAQGRNLTNEQLASTRQRVMGAHTEVAGFQAVDLQGVAAALTCGEGTDDPSFMGGLVAQGAQHYDIRAQLINTEAEQSVGNKSIKVEEVEPDDVQEEPFQAEPKAAKRQKIYEADRRNTALQSSWTTMCDAFLKEADTVKASMLQLVKEFDAPDSVHYEFLKPTIALVKARKKALDIITAAPVLHEKTVEELRAEVAVYIEGFETAEVCRGLAGSSSSQVTAVCDAPPIQKYRNLELVMDLMVYGLTKYSQCESEPEAKSVAKELAVRKQSAMDVLATCKACVGDVTRAVKGRARLTKLAQQVGSTNARIGGTGPMTPDQVRSSVFECASEHGVAASSFKEPLTKHDISTMNFAHPYVVNCSWPKELLSSADDRLATFRTNHKSFETKFSEWDKRSIEKRAGRPLKDEYSSKLISKNLEQCLGHPDKKIITVPDGQATPEIKKALEVQQFGVISSGESLSTEQFGLATLRVGLQGTRACIIMRCHELAEHVQTIQKLTERANLERLKVFLQSLTKDDIGTFMAAGNTVWHLTLGPGDVLYIPPACWIYEVTHKASDVMGLKRSFFINDSGVKVNYEWLSKELCNTGTVAKLALTLMDSVGPGAQAAAGAAGGALEGAAAAAAGGGEVEAGGAAGAAALEEVAAPAEEQEDNKDK
jgi:hypothetical protein